MENHDNYLVISDLQIPFQALGALDFCLTLKKNLRIPDENILCVGDELDQYFGSRYPKDPDGHHSAVSEINVSKKILREWYKAFPKMKIAISNHGLRWAKKAFDSEIPSQLMRSYQEVIEAPEGWVWKQEWKFNSEHPFRMIHGMGYSGKDGARNAAMDRHVSTVIGHIHSFAGIAYSHDVDGNLIWGFNVGCLIDTEQYAFEYSRGQRNKPILGCGVIMESGRLPVFIPYTGDK